MSSQFYSEWRTMLRPSGFAWRGHARPTGETCPSGEDGLVQQLRPRHANTASRRMTPESFASLDAPSLERAQGRPGAGWHPRSAVRKLREDRCTAAYRAARTSRPFPAQWFDGLWRALPGERCTIAPVALRMSDARIRSDSTHHRKTWRTDPGRQAHTILPYADGTGRVRDGFAHGCPPCEALRADAISVHRRPARVS